jgi:hypothetical protein
MIAITRTSPRGTRKMYSRVQANTITIPTSARIAANPGFGRAASVTIGLAPLGLTLPSFTAAFQIA